MEPNNIKLNPKKQPLISDEEMRQITEETPIGYIGENMCKIEEKCREHLKEYLRPYYERMEGLIQNAGDTERERFLINVKKSMENYINDTLSDGEDHEAKYIAEYFSEAAISEASHSSQLAAGCLFTDFDDISDSIRHRNVIDGMLRRFLNV